jgi:hypothetical protein
VRGSRHGNGKHACGKQRSSEGKSESGEFSHFFVLFFCKMIDAIETASSTAGQGSGTVAPPVDVMSRAQFAVSVLQSIESTQVWNTPPVRSANPSPSKAGELQIERSASTNHR